jgi:hypothetical protein
MIAAAITLPRYFRLLMPLASAPRDAARSARRAAIIFSFCLMLIILMITLLALPG